MFFVLYQCVFILFLLLSASIANAAATAADIFSQPNMLVTQSRQVHLYVLKNILPATALKALGSPGKGVLLKGDVVRALLPRRVLWVYAQPVVQQRIAKLLAVLDGRQAQWMVRADIIDIDKEYWRDLGSSFSMSGAHSEELPEGNAWGKSVPGEQSTNQLSLILGHFGQQVLQWKINALVRLGHAQRMASPVLVARDGQEAVIESGEEVPYQEKTGDGNTSVAFKKAVVSLKVVPHMLAAHNLLLDLTVKQDQVSTLRVNGVPAIQTERLHTVALLRAGQALVLGGITQRQQGTERDGVPWLHRLPLFGWLFSHAVRTRQKKSLLILLVPQWVSQGHAAVVQ